MESDGQLHIIAPHLQTATPASRHTAATLSHKGASLHPPISSWAKRSNAQRLVVYQMPGGSSSAFNPSPRQPLAEPALPLTAAACLFDHLAGCSTGSWLDELASETSRARLALLAEGLWLVLLCRDAPRAPVRACMPSLLILGRAAASQLPAGWTQLGMVALACCLLQLLGPLLAEPPLPMLLKA